MPPSSPSHLTCWYQILREDSPKLSCMRNTVWAISNLFRGKPQPPLSDIVSGAPTLVAVLQESDEEVLTDCCWALSYLTDGANERIQVCDATTVPCEPNTAHSSCPLALTYRWPCLVVVCHV